MNKKGFTLVELAVATGIFSVVCIAGIGILVGVMQSANRAMVQNELRQNASAAMETMIREVRRAKSINVDVVSGNPRLATYSNSICGGTADSTFVATKNAGFTGNLSYNGNDVLSSKTTIGTNTSFAGSGSCQTSGNITITLNLVATYGSTRNDFVGNITLRETVALRNY